ncbi:MAG: radical SAM protein [Verrucomicrobia bacterium]|nr:radical SAM protein [Verrucomicrobiota bacterium]
MPFRETSTADLSSGTVGFGIDVTTNCNLDCVTCYYLDSPRNRPVSCHSYIPFGQFELAMDKVSAAGFREIYILGGEPTLHPRILDMLESAMRRRFEQVLLVTNGLRLVDDDFCRRVAASGVRVVAQRHVMGEGQEERRIQDALAGLKGTLAQVNRAFVNIERMFDPAKVVVQCCLTRPVVESGQVFDVYRYAK